MPAPSVKTDNSAIPVVILAGGAGIAMGPQGSTIPKTMALAKGQPLLRHILGHYAAAGFSRFIVCAGAGGGLIRGYAEKELKGWDLTVLDTGEASMTGSRLCQAKDLLKADTFCLTYGDTVSDADLNALLAFHRGHHKTASLVAVHPQTRFRILGMVDDDDAIRGFADKPILQKDYINGGFYVLNASIFGCPKLSAEAACVLETHVLEHLVEKRDIKAMRYEGFWQQLDTERDRLKIEAHLERAAGR